MPSSRLVLKGNRRAMAPSSSLPFHDPGAWIEVTLKVRPRPQIGDAKRRIEALFQAHPNRRKYLSHAEHEAAFGAQAADLAKVEAFAHRHGLTVVDWNLAKRTVRLGGIVGQIQRAFGVRLRTIRARKASFHAHGENITLPRELKGVVRAVFGLDTRPIVRPHAALTTGSDPGGPGFSPRDICQLYNFPGHLDGSGQCLAIIETNSQNNLGVLGTGYLGADLDQFFSSLGLKTPAVTAIGGAGGAGNLPGPFVAGDAEAALDIQLAGSAAPGANIGVYFGLNNEQGYHDAVAAAVHDSVRKPKVISISWGRAEGEYTPAFMEEMNQLFNEAGTLGITICASAGDLGSSGKGELAADGVPHPSFPASSPFALACGGTTATAQNGAIAAECAWNGGYESGAGGGGVSDVFPLPAWQQSCQVPASAQKKWAGRGIPDLAAHADQASGYKIVVNGAQSVLGGTSAVAPLIAGLLTRINQSRAAAGGGPMGFVNPILYGNPDVFRDIVTGSNDIDGSLGVYAATKGWDACTGLGAPNGAALLKLLS